jgi:hypothetical protein
VLHPLVIVGGIGREKRIPRNLSGKVDNVTPFL